MKLGINPNLRKELNDFPSRTFYMSTVITFGKYKEKKYTIGEILDKKPEYIAWMVETFKNDKFDEDITDALSKVEFNEEEYGLDNY